MDFITKIPRKVKLHDFIMVVVDKSTKVAHFILVKKKHKETNIANIYMKKVARVYGIPKEIVTKIGLKFTSNFWKCLFKCFGTNLNLSTTYHPESDGKTNRTNKIIEDMLIMYVMDQPSIYQSEKIISTYLNSLTIMGINLH
jgi:hypothetical protein